MAKKKKKGAARPDPTESPSKPQGSAKKPPPAEPAAFLEDECSFLELKLRRSDSRAAVPSLKLDSSPVVFVDEIDASKIRLQTGSEVILLLKDEDSSNLAGALICKVDISVSVRSPDKGAKRKNNVLPGSCTLQPLHLIDSILESKDDPDESTKQTPITSPPPKTPQQSTPRSGFSFAKGGGGDVLINSPPPSTPSSSYASPQARHGSKSSLTVWIVPLTSPLGEDTASILCQTATGLDIRIKDEAKVNRIRDCTSVLKELFAAQTMGLYLHEKSSIVISFAGKPLELEIEQIHAPEGVTEKRNDLLLELEMEELEIRDEKEEGDSDFESQLWSRLRVSLESETRAGKLLLHRINRQTQINILIKDQVEGGESNQVRPSITPSSPRQVVVGLDTTVEKVKSFLLTPLLKPGLFAKGSMKPPRGLLLFGPSGVGKSSLARQLALDLEHENPGKIRVQTINCATIQSYSAQVGEAEQRLCRIFDKAVVPPSESGDNKNAGTLLIFDDIHLICAKRSGYSASSDRIAATLLALLDGIGSASSKQNGSLGGAISSSIVVLGITSDPSKLDPALRRPGRLDFEVEVPGPDDAVARAELLRFHLRELGGNYPKKELDDKDYLKLGEKAKGFTGADCMLSVKEAIRIAMSRDSGEKNGGGSEPLTIADLEQAIRQTKPSAIKSITVEIPTVLWSSIGGMDTVKDQLREAIELPETYSSLFEQLRIPPPKGVLLYGPPGCSKTLMARALATEGKMNFLAVKGPELLSKWLGESERALASLFRRARAAAPSIIFFDEIDAIAAERGSGGIGTGGGRLLSQLLTELDGITSTGGVNFGEDSKKNPRVVVVAATNRPDLIDKALMRPGRIDKKIYVGTPDEKSRHRIFEIGLRDRSCADDIDLPLLSKDEVSGGFSGAELIAACKDAAWRALEEDEEASAPSNQMPKIKMEHLMKAINGMQRQITPEMIEFYESFSKSSS